MWFKESNRYKHFLYGIPCGLIATQLFVLGIATGMEFKDYKYKKEWDWIDWLMTNAGGLIGQTIQAGILYLILK